VSGQSGAAMVVAQAHPGLVDWLAGGERGESSNVIVTALTGLRATKPWADSRAHRAHPYDPSDFRRCEMLLRDVPSLRPFMPHMAERSPVWARLVERWDDIVAMAEIEAPGVFDGGHGGAAPLTFALIRECWEAS